MNFWEAINSAFKNYATFKGRACRSEFWYFFLFCILISLIAQQIDFALHQNESGAISGIVSIILLVPGIALQVRRLHDIGKSGWWFFLNLIPLLGQIALIVFSCMRGHAETNQYGDNPLAEMMTDAGISSQQ